MARIFISYRRVAPDNDLAFRLYRKLADDGHDVFFDSESIQPGARWPATIRESVERAEWFIAIVSLAYLNSNNCLDELIMAMKRLEDRALHGIIPVRMAFDGELPAAVRDTLAAIQMIMWRGVDDTPQVLNTVVRELPRPATLIKGMHHFGVMDSATFSSLGREHEIEECLKLIDGRGTCVVVHGVSGAGKTSFVMAGVAPRLPMGQWQYISALTECWPFSRHVGSIQIVILDQFEHAVVAMGRSSQRASEFLDATEQWLAADRSRCLLVVLRDEFRTSFEAVLRPLARRSKNFALLPLAPPEAARVLSALLESAQVRYDESFVAALMHDLAEGVPPAVRPAMLQLIAQQCWESGAKLDMYHWGKTPVSRRTFFEAHVRLAVLDRLGNAIPRVDAARVLRALTAGELKSSPKTAIDVGQEEQLRIELASRTLKLASAPHARIVTSEEVGDSEKFQLVHDLFASAIHAVVKDEEGGRMRRLRQRVIVVLALLLSVSLTLGGIAVMLWRQSEQQRNRAQRSELEAIAAAQISAARMASEMSVRPGHEGEALAVAIKAFGTTHRLHIDPGPDLWRGLYDAAGALRRSLPLRYERGVIPAIEYDPQRESYNAAAFTRDGRWLITGDGYGLLCTWDSLSGKRMECQQVDEGISDVTLSSDGRNLCTISYGKGRKGSTLRLWRVKDEHLFQEHLLQLTRSRPSTVDSSPNEVAAGRCKLSPDGRLLLATRNDGLISIWQLSPSEPELAYELMVPGEQCPLEYLRKDTPEVSLIVSDASFSPDSMSVAGATWCADIYVWHLPPRQEGSSTVQLAAPLPWPRINKQHITSITYSPDGKQIVTTAKERWERTRFGALVWDVERKAATELPARHRAEVDGAVFSPDGMRLLTYSWDHSAHLYRKAAGGEWMLETTLQGHRFFILDAEFAPDGQRIVTTSSDGVRLWDFDRGPARIIQSAGFEVAASDVSLDGRIIALVASDGTTWFFDATEMRGYRVLAPALDDVIAVRLARDANVIALGTQDGVLEVHNLDTHTVIARRHLGAPIVGMAISANVTTIIAAMADGRVHQIIINDGQIHDQNLGSYGAPVNEAKASPDGEWLATYWNGHEVRPTEAQMRARLWPTRTSVQPVTTPLHHVVRAFAFSPDSSAVAQSQDRIWFWRMGELKDTIVPTFHENVAVDLAFSYDGKLLAAAAANRVAYVWTIGTERVRRAEGHTEAIERIGFAPSGKLAWTAGAESDGTVRIWSLAGDGPLTPVAILDGNRAGTAAVTWSPDETDLIVADRAGVVRVFPLAAEKTLAFTCELIRHQREATQVADLCEVHVAARTPR